MADCVGTALFQRELIEAIQFDLVAGNLHWFAERLRKPLCPLNNMLRARYPARRKEDPLNGAQSSLGGVQAFPLRDRCSARNQQWNDTSGNFNSPARLCLI